MDGLARTVGLGSIAMVTLSLASATPVRAQDYAQPRPWDEPRPDVEAETTAPAPVRRPAAGSCLIEPLGYDPGEVVAAGHVVCDEITTQRAHRAGELHRVRVGRTGRTYRIMVSRERVEGGVLASRGITIRRLEDVELAAPRLVTALTHDRSIAETASLVNLVESDVRRPHVRRSRFAFGGGVAGVWTVGEHGAQGGAGVAVMAEHHAPAWAIGGTFTFAGGEDGALMSVLVSGRYFLSDGTASAFVGGGAGYAYVDVHEASPGWDDDGPRFEGGGFDARLQIGVELLRDWDTRIGALASVDVPFFELTDLDGENPAYVVPLGVQVYCQF